MSNLVKCLECGKEFKSLMSHINRKHGLNGEQYQTKYPGAPLVSQVTKNRIKDAYTPERKAQQSKRAKENIGIYGKSQENRERASKQMTEYNNKMWKDPEYRKERSEQQKEVIARQLEDPQFRNILSDNGKKSWVNKSEESTRVHKEQASSQISKFNKESWECPIYREKMSKRASDGVRKGTFVYKPSCRMVAYNGEEYYVKSRWELAFILFCIDRGWDFEYEPLTVDYQDNNIGRTYTPDFFIKSQNCFYEVKGRIRDEDRQDSKEKAIKERGFKYKLLTENEMKDLGVWNFLNEARVLYNKNEKEIII